MGNLIIPYYAVGSGDEIDIGGVTYKVPLIDAAGRVYVNAKGTGAGEVLAARKVSVSDSTTRVTAVTPTSGKKIRIIACRVTTVTPTAFHAEVYFGTGAALSTNAGKEILYGGLIGTTEHNDGEVWPDGGGPIGAVDEVVSFRTSSDVAGSASVIVHYREE